MAVPSHFKEPTMSVDETAAQDQANSQFHELFDGVEDLIKRVSELDSPEIQKIRA